MVLQRWCRMFLSAYLIGLLLSPGGRPSYPFISASVFPMVLRFVIDCYDNSCVVIALCWCNGRVLVYVSRQ